MVERIIATNTETGLMPEIIPGAELLITPNYRVVTDYKPELEGERTGERFFLEPRTSQGLTMLLEAAKAHNIYNFNHRSISGVRSEGLDLIPCLRADYSAENIPALFTDVTEIPKAGEDTIPSPARMEVCLVKKGDYTFADDLPANYAIPNPTTRHLRLLQTLFKDEIPSYIVHSGDSDSYYKVRKNWWNGVCLSLDAGLDYEFKDLDIQQHIEKFLNKYYNLEFGHPDNLTTSQNIAEANRLISQIWEKYGSPHS